MLRIPLINTERSKERDGKNVKTNQGYRLKTINK